MYTATYYLFLLQGGENTFLHNSLLLSVLETQENKPGSQQTT